MSINKLSAAGLQRLVRKILSLDIEAVEKLEFLYGKTILVNVTDIQLQYYFAFADGQVFIYPEPPPTKKGLPDEASVAITGTLKSFITAAVAEHSSDALFEGDLHFSGEISTAKQFQQLAGSLNIDWQEPLAKLVGDPLAHTISTGIQHVSQWFMQAANSARQDFSEYIQEEARLTPSDSEQQYFFEQVDQLRSRTDRLFARIEQLKTNQLAKGDD